MPLYELENVDTPVMTQFSLKGKIAVVTGGSKGIGLQVVTGLAEAGADVAFIYVDTPDADDVAKKIAKKTGSRVAAFEMDVTDRKGLRDTIESIARDFGHGRLDIVVANAGVCAEVPALKYDEKSWNFINRVNYDGVMWTALAAGGIFRRQGRGNLIITASISATVVNLPQRQAAYNSSKAAVVMLAKNLAVEWADFARVNCISPGYVLTESMSFSRSFALHCSAANIDSDLETATRLSEDVDLHGPWRSAVQAGRAERRRFFIFLTLFCLANNLQIYTFMASDASCYMTGTNINVDGGLSLP